jgi:hypothetical protein
MKEKASMKSNEYRHADPEKEQATERSAFPNSEFKTPLFLVECSSGDEYTEIQYRENAGQTMRSCSP